MADEPDPPRHDDGRSVQYAARFGLGGRVRMGGRLFLAWTALGNAAVVGFGAAVVHSGYPAAWSGWATIVLASAMLVQLLVTGDALPALYHVAPALIGVALIGGRAAGSWRRLEN